MYDTTVIPICLDTALFCGCILGKTEGYYGFYTRPSDSKSDTLSN